MSDLAPSPDPQPPPPDDQNLFQLLRIEISQSVLVSPEHLLALNQIDPELARRVVDRNLKAQEQLLQDWLQLQAASRELQKEEQKSRHKQELQELKAAIDDRTRGRDLQGRGQWIATGVTAGGFVLCGIAIVLRLEAVAIALGCGMIAVLAAVFISGRLVRHRQPDPPPSSPPDQPEP